MWRSWSLMSKVCRSRLEDPSWVWRKRYRYKRLKQCSRHLSVLINCVGERLRLLGIAVVVCSLPTFVELRWDILGKHVHLFLLWQEYIVHIPLSDIRQFRIFCSEWVHKSGKAPKYLPQTRSYVEHSINMTRIFKMETEAIKFWGTIRHLPWFPQSLAGNTKQIKRRASITSPQSMETCRIVSSLREVFDGIKYPSGSIPTNPTLNTRCHQFSHKFRDSVGRNNLLKVRI